jgi:curli biogenesis system outer membrane secretion channel CsgG
MREQLKKVLREQFEVSYKQTVLQKFIDRVLLKKFDITYEEYNNRKQKVGETTYSYPPEAIKVTSFQNTSNTMEMFVYFPHKASHDGNTVMASYKSRTTVEQEIKRIANRYNIILTCWFDTTNNLKYDSENYTEYVKLQDETEIGGLNYVFKM